jgi:hypothetical protein
MDASNRAQGALAFARLIEFLKLAAAKDPRVAGVAAAAGRCKR